MHVSIDQRSFNREKRRLDRLFEAIRQESLDAAKKLSAEYESVVKSGIGKTTRPWFAPDWQPLSPVWKYVYKKSNIEKFWLETGGILRATKVSILTKTTKLIIVFSGIRKMTDPNAFERAERNEYGYGLGPARPLFEPAKAIFSEMTSGGRRLKSHITVFKEVVLKAVKKVY